MAAAVASTVGRVEAEPAFAQAWSARVASVAPRSVYNLEAVDLDLSPGFLGELTERVRGRLRVAVRSDAAILAEQSLPVVEGRGRVERRSDQVAAVSNSVS